MDVESVRAMLLKLPRIVETMQWGDNLVYWVGDKAIGGKMFALVTLDSGGKAVMSFSAGPERYAELVEHDGIIPAPYMARIYWVALERWNALPAAELTPLLKAAADLTYDKLPRRTKDVLALPPSELRTLLAERKKLLAAKSSKEKAQPKKVDPAKTSALVKPRPFKKEGNKKAD